MTHVGGLARHRTIVVVDVEGYGSPRRTTPHRLAVRAGLYQALRTAFDDVSIPWDDCHVDDCGDGVFFLAPAEMPKAVFLEELPGALATALRRYNASCPEEERIRLRMGLHAGEVAYDDHGVTAPSVILAFRLLDSPSLKKALAESPGILALITSSWFFDEVVRHSRRIDSATFRPVSVVVKETNTTGWVSLPDSPYPAVSMRSDDRTRGAVPCQLPPLPQRMAGRQAELAVLGGLEADGGDPAVGALIFAFAGIGGIGKTWLALHWAYRNLGRFPDGQLFVDLRGYSPDEQPLPVAAAVRGFLDALGEEPADLPVDLHAQAARYRALVKGKRMLIVLDNAFDSAHVEALLPNTPTCTVIVTSRKHLTGLLARHRVTHVPLGTLSAADSRNLFIERLGTARAEAEQAAVERLLGYCGGLPLALSIVAGGAQARPHLPLASLAAEIDDLGLDALDNDDSRASLRGVLSWSTAALAKDEVEVFRLLGVAPGPDIGLPAAAGLVGLSVAEVRKRLRRLEQASLVTQDGSGRYRMHDRVREYAVDECAAEEREVACRRVVDFYLHTAYEADKRLRSSASPFGLGRPVTGSRPQQLPDRAAALAWFHAERTGALAAQRVAAAYAWREPVWQLAWCLSTFHYRQGHRHDQVEAWEAGVQAAEELAEPAVIALARRNLGNAYTFAERYGDGQEQQQRVLRLAEAAGDVAEQGHAHYALAVNWERAGDLRRALEHARRARKLFTDLGLPLHEADALNAIGWYTAQLGDHDRGRRACEEAIALFHGHQDIDGLAGALSSLAGIAQLTGRHAEAAERYAEALVLFRGLGHTHEVANTLGSLGHSLVALGRRAEADQVWGEALEQYQAQVRLSDAEHLRRQLTRLMEARAREF